MDLVVDANILFAILIKESCIEDILFNDSLRAYCSEFTFIEIDKHLHEILDKSSREEEDVMRLLAILRKKITFVPLEDFAVNLDKAESLSPDPDDLVYFALALKLNCAIWSNDKQLKKQNEVPVYNTQELIQMLKM